MPTEHLPTSLPPHPSARPILVVGQNPGHTEDEQGRPFVGKSGDLVRGRAQIPSVFLPPSILSSHPVYLSNLVRCFHQSTEPLKARWIRPCSPYLVHDLRRIAHIHEPDPLIYTLGGPAATGVYRLANIKHNLSSAINNQFTPVTIDGIRASVFSTYHPAFLLRNKNIIHPIKDHLTLLIQYLEDRMPTASQPHIIPPRRPPT